MKLATPALCATFFCRRSSLRSACTSGLGFPALRSRRSFAACICACQADAPGPGAAGRISGGGASIHQGRLLQGSDARQLVALRTRLAETGVCALSLMASRRNTKPLKCLKCLRLLLAH